MAAMLSSAPAICAVRRAAPAARNLKAVMSGGSGAVWLGFAPCVNAMSSRGSFARLAPSRTIVTCGRSQIRNPDVQSTIDARRPHGTRRPLSSAITSGSDRGSSPHRPNSQLASIVSTSGMGAADRPAARAIPKASATSTPRLCSPRSTSARCNPASMQACQSCSGHTPSSARRSTVSVHCAANRRETVVASVSDIGWALSDKRCGEVWPADASCQRKLPLRTESRAAPWD